MADTTFVAGTVVQPSWLNDVNRFVYDAQIGGTTTGAALIKFLQAGTGATTVTAQEKMRQKISVEDFGAPTTGDASAAFLAACTYAATLGGAIVSFKKNYSILTSFTTPDDIHLQGELIAPGQIQDGGTGGNYDALGSVLKIASTATITLGSSSSISNFIAIRSDLDLPFANLAAAQAGVPLFAGTAITIGGDDAKVENALFLGFAKAISSTNRGRMRFYNVQGDCTNGIDVSNALDTVYLDQCHFWPFTTANYSWTSSDATQLILTRSGIAYHFHDTVDWPKITNVFSYGYFRGFRFHNCNAISALGSSADGPVNAGVPVHSGSIGVLIEGTSVDNKLADMYVAGKSQGYYNNATIGNTEYSSCDAVACTIGIDVQNANDVTVIGGLLRNCSYGIQVANATALVKIHDTKIRDYLTKPVNVSTATSKLFLYNVDFVAPAAGASMSDNASNWTLPTVASTDPLNLPGHVGDVFLVSGTTNFGTLNGGYPGRTVTLLFSGALTVLNGGSMRLNGGVNFAAASGCSLKLTWDGGTWREVGRCT